MNVSVRHPSSMTAAERRAELAGLLARGYVRHLAAQECSQNPLADGPESEAPCDPVNVYGNENPEPEDVA